MEIFSALLAICAGNYPVSGEFLAQRPVTRSFDVFFDLSRNKRLSKQSWAGDLRRLCAHYDAIVMLFGLQLYDGVVSTIRLTAVCLWCHMKHVISLLSRFERIPLVAGGFT